MDAPEEKVAEKRQQRVFIVDDHPIVRQGLAQLLNQEAGLEVCGEAEDAEETMGAVERLKPDVIIMDLSLKKSNGLQLIKDIKMRYRHLPILVLSMHDESLYAERSLRAGARGYVMKQEATETLVAAIRRILQGEIYVSDQVATTMLQHLVGDRGSTGQSPIERLSDRELEVLGLIGKGYGTREIAQLLHLSVKTVESHRSHIKEKLKLQNAAALTRYAIHWFQSEEAQ